MISCKRQRGVQNAVNDEICGSRVRGYPCVLRPHQCGCMTDVVSLEDDLICVWSNVIAKSCDPPLRICTYAMRSVYYVDIRRHHHHHSCRWYCCGPYWNARILVFMYVCVCICVFVCMCVSVCLRVYIFVLVCETESMCMSVHVCLYGSVATDMFVSLNVWVYLSLVLLHSHHYYMRLRCSHHKTNRTATRTLCLTYSLWFRWRYLHIHPLRNQIFCYDRISRMNEYHHFIEVVRYGWKSKCSIMELFMISCSTFPR